MCPRDNMTGVMVLADGEGDTIEDIVDMVREVQPVV